MLLYGAAFAAAGLTPFILLPVLTKFLSPAEFGEATSFLILTAMIGNFAGLSAHGFVAVRYFKSTAGEFKGIVSSSLLCVGAAHLLVLLLVPMLFQELKRWFDLSPVLVLLAILAAVLVSLNQVFLAIHQSSGKPALYLRARLVQAALEIFICVGLVLTVAANSSSRVASYVVAMAACVLLGLRYCRRANYLGLAYNKRDAKALLSFAVPMVPHIMAGTAITYIDRVMVSSLLGVDTLGIYMVAMQIGMAMSVLIEPMNKALAPWLFEQLSKNDDRVNRAVVKSTYLFYAGLVTAGLIVIVVAQLLFDRVIGVQYAAAKPLVPLMVAGFVFQGMYYTVVNYIFYVERTGSLSAISTTTATLGSALSYLLISQFGMAGAGISFAFTNLVLFVLVWIVASRLVSMPWLLR
ncbi:MAG: lipopolysaccharide biosynthesis protein [Steroidobacteraceae bacterium]